MPMESLYTYLIHLGYNIVTVLQFFINVSFALYHWYTDLDYNSVDADQILSELIYFIASAIMISA